MASQATIGSLGIDLGLNTARFNSGLRQAGRSRDRFVNRTKRQTRELRDSFRNVALGFVGALSTGAAFNKLIEVGREFDRLNAQLITATGSSENAAAAFKELETFAAETPFALEQSVDAFVKLVNLGLDPSERALRSFGNTASAMGKDLSQFIEAVADASTAEFERLKEFGIRAKNQGDTIAFTFRGITTEVGNNAREIQEFLTQIGENEFAGAMAERAATLDGALSNLGDAWDGLFREISQGSIGELIEDQVRMATRALQSLGGVLDAFTNDEKTRIQRRINQYQDETRALMEELKVLENRTGFDDFIDSIFGIDNDERVAKLKRQIKDLTNLAIEENERLKNVTGGVRSPFATGPDVLGQFNVGGEGGGGDGLVDALVHTTTGRTMTALELNQFWTKLDEDLAKAARDTDMERTQKTITNNIAFAIESGAELGAKGMVDTLLRIVQTNLVGQLAGSIASALPGAGPLGFVGKLLSFGGGGDVPGPRGEPRLIIAHGGERVLTPEQQESGGLSISAPVSITGLVTEEDVARGFEMASAQAQWQLRQDRMRGRRG